MNQKTRHDVLIVGDSNRSARLAETLGNELESVRVRLATSLAEARRPEASLPAAMIADLDLPDGSGLELIGSRPVPLILTLPEEDTETAVAAMRQGAEDCVIRRGDWEARILATLRRVLSRPSPTSESRDVYLGILDDFPLPVWRTDADGRCDYFNRMWTTFTGRPAEELIESAWNEGAHPHDRDRIDAAFWEAFRNRAPFRLEYRMRRHDGEYRWVEDSAHPYEDTEGNFGGYLGAFLDITDRVRADHKFRGLLESAPDAMVITDKDGRIELTNAETRRLFGYSNDELTGRPVGMLFQGGGRTSSFDFGYFSDPDSPSTSAGKEAFGLRKDATVFPAEILLSLVETSGHTQVASAIRDISDRKRAEQETRESERRLRNLVENAPVCIKELDLKGRILSVNPAGLRVAHAESPSALVGVSVTDVIDPRDREGMKRLLRKAAEGEAGAIECTVHFSETPQIVTCRLVPLRGPEGGIERIMSIVEDVTEQREARARLEASERQYRAIVETSLDVILLLNEAGTILYASPSAEEILAQRNEDMVGRPIWDFLHSDSRPVARQAHEYTLAHPEDPRTLRVRMRRGDGSWAPVQARGQSHDDGRGSLLVVVHLARLDADAADPS